MDSFLVLIPHLDLRFITATRKIRAEVQVHDVYEHFTKKPATDISAQNTRRESYACLTSVMPSIKQDLAEWNHC